MTVLMKAHDQWARRAPDERFGSLKDLHAAALSDRENGATSSTNLHGMKVITDESGALKLQGPSGNAAELTNWSFNQLCDRAKARGASTYLPSLPASLAAECLNANLAALPADDSSDVKLLFKRNGSLKVRAMTGDVYERIWNVDITERLLGLEASGNWKPAPAAFDGSRGLYLGDRDMFAFMVDNERRIFETLPGGGLSRGFFVWNSEVGASSLGVMTFLYEYVCGNHRVWGVSEVRELRFRHVGKGIHQSFRNLQVDLLKYAEASTSEDEAKIKRARAMELGATKDEVLDRVFAMKAPALTMKLLGKAYDLAEKRVDWYGNPRSVWGFGGALTEIARDLPNADSRVALERATQKVMEIAF